MEPEQQFQNTTPLPQVTSSSGLSVRYWIAGLVIIIAALLGVIAWFYFLPANISSKTVSEEGNEMVVGNTRTPRVIFIPFDSLKNEYTEPRVVVSSNLDGSDASTSTTPYLFLTINSYNVTGQAPDGTLYAYDHNDGSFAELSNIGEQNKLIISPDRSSVVYVRQTEGAGKYQLWLNSIQGTTPSLLVEDLEKFGVEGFPLIIPLAFSADGKKVYLRYQQRTPSHEYMGWYRGLYVLDLATKGLQRIDLVDIDQDFATDLGIDSLILSPDHKKIAFSTFADSLGEESIFTIYDLATETGEQFAGSILSVGIGQNSMPWSPDSSKFAYVSSSSIAYIDLTDGTSHLVGAPNGGFASLYWLSPKNILAIYQTYNKQNKTYWDKGSTIFDISTDEKTDFLEPFYLPGLIGIIPVR